MKMGPLLYLIRLIIRVTFDLDLTSLRASTGFVMKRMGLKRCPCGTPMLVFIPLPIVLALLVFSSTFCISIF